MTAPNKDIPPSQYRSYLLRLWLEDAPSKTPWRIVLINPQTGKRWGFVDFGHLVDFLKEGQLKDETTSEDVHEPTL